MTSYFLYLKPHNSHINNHDKEEEEYQRREEEHMKE
jgi:hypothetical protein